MKKLLKSLAYLTIIASLASCMSIRSDKYSRIESEQLKISSIKKSKVFIDWGFDSTLVEKYQQNIIDQSKSDQKKIFSDVIKESDCCDLVSDKEEANIIIKGAFHNETDKTGIYFAYLSGATMTVIPCWSNSKMRIDANVTKGQMVRSYDINDSVFTAIWLPLIIATPFANAITVEAEVNKNLYKNLLSQIKRDGFFGK